MSDNIENLKSSLIECKKELFVEEFMDESVIGYIFSQRFNALHLATLNLTHKYKKVALYGFGLIGKMVADILLNQLSVIVDRSTNDTFYRGIPIKSPHELDDFEYDVLVICVLGRENEIENYLKSLNIKQNNIFTFNLLDTSVETPKNDLNSLYTPLVTRLKDNNPIIGVHPLNIQIQTVSNCNATCYFCPYHGSWHQKNPGKMSMEMYKKLIDNLKQYKIKKFCPYLENEPLLDQDLFEKIAYAIEVFKPEIVEVATNISVLNEKVIKGLREVLITVPHELRVSFHGIDEQSYSEVMGLDFDKSLENVKVLVEMMQNEPLNLMIRGSGKPRESNSNVKFWFGEEEYYKFWKKELANYKVQPVIDFFTYHDRASQKQLTKKGVDFNVYREDLKDFYCSRFDQWVHFLYTGEPILCCMDYNRETVFPDSLHNNSIDELYQSEYFIETIKKATGLCESEDDFICKRCVSPGG